MNIQNVVKSILFVGCTVLGINSSEASRLPDDVWSYIRGELPNSTQRFDSVVLLDRVNMYVPLYPAKTDKVDKIAVKYTYPAGKTLKNQPEVVVLNNNFVLLKIYKNSKGNYTITQNENLPKEVKLGVMPQDMIIPTGLEIPESLKIILGNLVIPKRGDNLVITASDSTLGESEDSNDANIVPMAELKHTKAFFATNKSKFILVYDRGGEKPLYEIKLSGLLNQIVASPVSKYALALYFGTKTSEIIDLVNERVLTKIDFENIPTDADFDNANQIAYVTSAKSGSIYMVDLNSASLVKTIKTDRAPNKISVSSPNKLLVFSDKNNENIYLMNLETYDIKKIDTVLNIGKLIINNDKVIAISRTQNKAFIYQIKHFDDEIPAELISEVRLPEKPTDAVIYKNKLFILSSKAGMITVYDLFQNQMTDTIELDKTGFYSKITPVPNQTNAIITGLNTKKIIMIDLEKATLTKKVTGNINVNELVIIDDKPYAVPNTPNVEEEL